MDQFEKWLAAYSVFQAHYANYQENCKCKWFYGLIATAAQYKYVDSAKTAVTANVQKWVTQYVNKTGPNNTGRSALDFKKITKQHKRIDKELEGLIEGYIPFLGSRQIHIGMGVVTSLV